jgi:hypothetical protein
MTLVLLEENTLKKKSKNYSFTIIRSKWAHAAGRGNTIETFKSVGLYDVFGFFFKSQGVSDVVLRNNSFIEDIGYHILRKHHNKLPDGVGWLFESNKNDFNEIELIASQKAERIINLQSKRSLKRETLEEKLIELFQQQNIEVYFE